MSENDKVEPEIDVRSVRTPEELGLITEEIKKEVESEVEIEGKLMEGVDDGLGLPGEETPKELTEEEKHAIYIQNLKDSRIKFHPIKHGVVKSEVVSVTEGVFGRKKKQRGTTIITNITTNQFDSEYRKKRQRKNKMQKASRRLAHKK